MLGGRTVIGNRHLPLTKPTRISLAEFTRNLKPSESPGPVCATISIGAESGGRKRFAAGVVVAMSNPAPDCVAEPEERPDGPFAVTRSKVGS